MRKAERELTDFSAVEALLRRGQVCHISFAVDGQAPYVVPLNYGYADRALYIHGATRGRKADLLRAGPLVGISITVDYALVKTDTPCGWTSNYASVIATGRAQVAETRDEKHAWLTLLMAHYTAPSLGGFDFPDKILNKTLVARIALTDICAKVKPSPKGPTA